MAFTQSTPIGVPDADLITQTLASLQPDSALQQYAAMHKNNPYIMSLADAESKRRKTLRAAAAAGQPPAPKVADASIAGMAPAPVAQTALPENQGIAQLPTPNMRTMADGGIAGYDDDMMQSAEPVIRMSGGGHIPRYQGNTVDGSVVRSNPMFNVPGMVAVQPRADFTQQGAPENTPFFQRVFESLSSGNKERQLAMIAQKIAQGTATAEETAIYQAEIGKKSGQKQMGAPKDVVNPDEVLMATEKAGRFKTTTDKATADKAPAAAAAAPTAQVKMPSGIATLKEPTAADAKAKATEFYDSTAQIRRLEQQKLQEREDIAGQKETRLAQLDAFNKEKGPAYAGYEKLLKSEELQDTTDKEKAGLQALFKGFLAIAAGESPNAATNIAKGSMAGLEEYSGAMKEFKKAAKERNKAMADIENARRAESRDDLKSQQAYEDKADTRLTESNRLFTNAVMQVTGKEAEISSSIFGKMVDNAEANKRLMYSEGAQTARTMATLNAPDPQSKFYGNLGGGDPKKGLEFFSSVMGPEGKGIQALLSKYADPMKLELLKNTDPDMYNFVKTQMRMQLQPQPMGKPTGPVRD